MRDFLQRYGSRMARVEEKPHLCFLGCVNRGRDERTLARPIRGHYDALKAALTFRLRGTVYLIAHGNAEADRSPGRAPGGSGATTWVTA